jgi:Thioesterase-like superfamily
VSQPAAFFLPDGDRFVPTELTRGPWDPAAQHGGPPAALLGRALERGGEDRPELQVARVTVELLRPVPLHPLEIATRPLKQGRSVELTEATITADGVEVLRARGLRVRAAPAGTPAPAGDGDPLPGPEQGDPGPSIPLTGPVGYHTAMEWRYLRGSFVEPGPATVWLRMRHPLVPGEIPSPLQRVLIAADSGNGISAVLDWRTWRFINPDLTVYLSRRPLGEWICLDARTSVVPGAPGLAASTIHDRHGPVGHALQALLVAPR